MAVIIGCSSLPHLITGDGDAEIAKKARMPPIHFDKVFGLSLGGPCRFRFRRRQGERWERFTLSAEPRSLYSMDGEAREVWEHSIPPVEQRRYSITFRTMRTKDA